MCEQLETTSQLLLPLHSWWQQLDWHHDVIVRVSCALLITWPHPSASDKLTNKCVTTDNVAMATNLFGSDCIETAVVGGWRVWNDDVTFEINALCQLEPSDFHRVRRHSIGTCSQLVHSHALSTFSHLIIHISSKIFDTLHSACAFCMILTSFGCCRMSCSACSWAELPSSPR